MSYPKGTSRIVHECVGVFVNGGMSCCIMGMCVVELRVCLCVLLCECAM
jgi:hypothetical protein